VFLLRVAAAIQSARRRLLQQQPPDLRAIAFQILIAAIALVLLGFALSTSGAGVALVGELWPFVEVRFALETYLAIPATVERIFAARAHPAGSGRAPRRLGGLRRHPRAFENVERDLRAARDAFAVIVCLVGAVLATNLIPRAGALPSAAGHVIGWSTAVVLTGCAIWLLLRYAPRETRSAGWTSVGSVFIVVSWVIASLLFAFYVQNVAATAPRPQTSSRS
jgi:Virulence factor BrkB